MEGRERIFREDRLMYIACPRFSKLGDVRKELEIYIYMEWMVQGSWHIMG